MSSGTAYSRALQALESAHEACFRNPDRSILGMSYGPFSGVNVALGIVRELEAEVEALRYHAKRETAQRAAVVLHMDQLA